MTDGATALLVIDLQNDFCPGGSLAVPGGDEIVAPVNALMKRFSNVVLTQDWHPEGHASFASTHAGRKPFDAIDLAYGRQVLWPDHCVIGSRGADFHPALDVSRAQAIIRKGFRKDVDSYSGFLEADRRTPTGLGAYLKERGLTRLFVCGLATDFCVHWTAVDASALGFETLVIAEASRAIDAGGSLAAAWRAMEKAGVKRATAAEI